MTDPTEPLETAAPGAEPETTAPTRRRRVAIVIGGVLIAAGVALAIWAVSVAVSAPEGADAPVTAPSMPATSSPTQTPSVSSATPEAAATTEPPASGAPPTAPAPPAAGAPVISSFTVQPETVRCPDERDSTVPLIFSWRSEGAERAWIGVNTSDASVQPAAEVAASAEGYAGISFACRDADQIFTLTVQGSGGTVSSTIAIARELE